MFEFKNSNNKSFGFFFSFIFIILSLVLLINGEGIYSIALGCLALIFVILSISSPNTLMPLHFLWSYLGFLLGIFFRPIVLGIIFFIILSPLAIMLRLFGRDELKLKKINKASFWQVKENHKYDEEFFKDQ